MVDSEAPGRYRSPQSQPFFFGRYLMKARASYLYIVLACLVFVVPAVAQEGHPLAGTWHGNWGPDAKTRHDLTVFMDWDGKAVTGLVNPGYDQSPLQAANLNPKDWTVHFEIDSKDAGKPVHCVVDGKIDKLG